MERLISTEIALWLLCYSINLCNVSTAKNTQRAEGWEVLRLNKSLHRTSMTNHKALWAIASKLLYVTQVCLFLLEFEGQAPEPLQALGNSSPGASVHVLWDCQNHSSSGTLQRTPDQLPNPSHCTIPQAAMLVQGWRQKHVAEGGGKSKTGLLW